MNLASNKIGRTKWLLLKPQYKLIILLNQFKIWPNCQHGRDTYDSCHKKSKLKQNNVARVPKNLYVRHGQNFAEKLDKGRERERIGGMGITPILTCMSSLRVTI